MGWNWEDISIIWEGLVSDGGGGLVCVIGFSGWVTGGGASATECFGGDHGGGDVVY